MTSEIRPRDLMAEALDERYAKMRRRLREKQGYPNPFEFQGFADFWLRIEREWAEYWKKWEYYPFNGVDDPDHETCPVCGLVDSCMCADFPDEITEELDYL